MITSDFPESMFVDFPMDNFHGLGGWRPYCSPLSLVTLYVRRFV